MTLSDSENAMPLSASENVPAPSPESTVSPAPTIPAGVPGEAGGEVAPPFPPMPPGQKRSMVWTMVLVGGVALAAIFILPKLLKKKGPQ